MNFHYFIWILCEERVNIGTRRVANFSAPPIIVAFNIYQLQTFRGRPEPLIHSVILFNIPDLKFSRH
jgi:hypothetical protein